MVERGDQALEQIGQLRGPLFEDKVVDLIVSKAKVKDKKVSKDELMAALDKGLKLPAHFGSNWDALSDCLTDETWAVAPSYLIIVQGAIHAAKARWLSLPPSYMACILACDSGRC